jgi:tripartite-type tricarboxylate transporter receptor subunit TctC
VTQVNSAPLMLVLHPSLPARSVPELIAYARAHPGKLNYGSGGVGSTPYLATEWFKSMAGIDVVHVPYGGAAPALADLVAGQLSFMIENVPGTMPFVKDGKLRALAITSATRSPLAPELPTMAEAGVPGYEMIGWNGVFVPNGTPPRIVDRLAGEIIAVVGTPEVKPQLAKLWRRTCRQPARRFRPLHDRRGHALGQDHRGARHQAGVVNPSSRPERRADHTTS